MAYASLKPTAGVVCVQSITLNHREGAVSQPATVSISGGLNQEAQLFLRKAFTHTAPSFAV